MSISAVVASSTFPARVREAAETIASALPVTRVPTAVSYEVTTVDFRIVFVRVLASAVTTMFADPSKDTVFIVRAVCNIVALPAFPIIVV